MSLLSSFLLWILKGELRKIDVRRPLSYVPGTPLAPLLQRMQEQNDIIARLEQELQSRNDRFFAVTHAMAQGLLLLDGEGKILSLNDSAARILDVSPADCIGHSILAFRRDKPLLEVLSRAALGYRGENLLELKGRTYQLLGSPVLLSGSQSVVVQILLFLLDVTEKVGMEQMRREFSANVSHELKTPLQSILGAAELLEHGLVQPSDAQSFLGRIHSEAQRMSVLVDDILRLSRLDEGDVSIPWEQVELHEMAHRLCQRLTPLAEQKNVTILVQGGSCMVEGVSELLYDMLQNLCTNAIRYNRPGGSVTITTEQQPNTACVTVVDTGIGIPPQHQSRVFERFYRVDKSHSRETGGTGLGLSIVKHTVLYHHGNVSLRSSTGTDDIPSGTSVTVTLPLHRSGR